MVLFIIIGLCSGGRVINAYNEGLSVSETGTMWLVAIIIRYSGYRSCHPKTFSPNRVMWILIVRVLLKLTG